VLDVKSPGCACRPPFHDGQNNRNIFERTTFHPRNERVPQSPPQHSPTSLAMPPFPILRHGRAGKADPSSFDPRSGPQGAPRAQPASRPPPPRPPPAPGARPPAAAPSPGAPAQSPPRGPTPRKPASLQRPRRLQQRLLRTTPPRPRCRRTVAPPHPNLRPPAGLPRRVSRRS
jgi:hypothetical protein